MMQTVEITRDDIARHFEKVETAVELERLRWRPLTRRVIAWVYRTRPFRFTFTAGAEHESDPDSFVAWVYLGFFGVALGWCRCGWVRPKEVTAEFAVAVLKNAPAPNVQTAAFTDEWDNLDNEDNRIDAQRYRELC